MPKVLRPHDYKEKLLIEAERFIGKKFGKLTAIRVVNEPGYKVSGVYYYCECDCGGSKTVMVRYLQRKCVKSCGCIKTGSPSIYNIDRGISIQNHCPHCKCERDYKNNACVTCGLKIPDKNYKTKQRRLRNV